MRAEQEVWRKSKDKTNMKRILITGANSYIGTSVERYLLEYNAKMGRELYHIDTLSLRNLAWEQYDFSSYDTIFHVAGIAHADIGHVSEETKKQYYEVNCDLAVKTAEKAKREGVTQFIYMSSVIVYGESAPVGGKKHITAETKPAPANFYGDSKWQAEQQLRTIESGQFSVAVLRPPMIYGRNSKGNFKMLLSLAQKTPVFPSISNERSMLYIENLAEFVRLLIDSQKGGLFFPQNAEYVTTAQMVKAIGEADGKNITLLGMLNPFVRLAAKMPGKIGGMANKAFGTLTIDQGLSVREIDGYQKYDLMESVKKSVG